tara:strand:- start:167 stop:283 length:117 start_codon:yes stop_codon:yes gene_type:complete
MKVDKSEGIDMNRWIDELMDIYTDRYEEIGRRGIDINR